MTATTLRQDDPDVLVRDRAASRHSYVAGSVLAAHLTDVPGCYIPGEPAGLAALLAGESVRDFLDTIGVIYDVREWSREEFRRAVVEGAIEGLRPDTIVSESPHALTITSATCPIQALTENDPRACRACRAFMEGVAREALPGQLQEVASLRLITRGDGVCETSFRFHLDAKEDAR